MKGGPFESTVGSGQHVVQSSMDVIKGFAYGQESGVIHKCESSFVFVFWNFHKVGVIDDIQDHREWVALPYTVGDGDPV